MATGDRRVRHKEKKETKMMSKNGRRISFILGHVLLIGTLILTAPLSARAVEFETIRSNMKNMTSVAWDDYSNSLKGQSVSWSGWISDVKEQWLGGYKILIDMDPPGSASVQDVYIEDIDKSVAARFSKDQKVRFSGRIKSVMSVLGSCAVTLENASINGNY
jgi:hypothetical protein